MEIKSVIRESIAALLYDDDFLSQLAKKVTDKTNLPALEEQVNNLEEENMILKYKLAAIEQKNHQDNLRISGIQAEENEINLLDRVLAVLNTNLGTSMATADIDACYYVGRVTDKRSIILKVREHKTKELIMKSRKKLKNTGIKISEDMCKTFHSLFIQAINEFGSKNVWFANGTIFAHVDNRKNKIRNTTDINKLKK